MFQGIDVVGADSGGIIKAVHEGAGKVLDAATKKDDPTAPSKPEKGHHGDDEESFFSKTVAGPVKVWHALLGAIGAAGGVWYWKFRK